jgi:sarcosine oxidase
MSERFDVIVVGLGAMGSACARALAERGLRVLGLERFDLPHGFGSSGGQSRMVRMAYFEHPDYVPLLRRAYEGWDELGEAIGTTLFHRTGLLYLGRAEQMLLEGTRRAAREHDIELESLDDDELGERFPQVRKPEAMEALFEPDAGLVLCERAIESAAELARRAGAELRCRERVTEWGVVGDGVEVTSERGRYAAGHVVFTAGAWTETLVQELGVELRVTRQPLGWVAPKTPKAFEIGRFPCWAIQDDADGFEGIYYGFPSLPAARFAGERGFKLAHHSIGRRTTAETVDREPTRADEADFRPALTRYFPDADGPTVAVKICLYTVTPDEHFILDRHPGHPQVTVACGFSGHGFKLAPAMGEALADLATEGRSDLPIGFLSLDRFSSD